MSTEDNTTVTTTIPEVDPTPSTSTAPTANENVEQITTSSSPAPASTPAEAAPAPVSASPVTATSNPPASTTTGSESASSGEATTGVSGSATPATADQAVEEKDAAGNVAESATAATTAATSENAMDVEKPSATTNANGNGMDVEPVATEENKADGASSAATSTPAADEDSGPPPLESPQQQQESIANAAYIHFETTTGPLTEKVDLSQTHAAAAFAFLMKQPRAADWFGVPVDFVALNIPNYPTVVKQPMDLGTVSKRLEAGTFYPTEKELIDDVKLTFSNAMLFNPPANIVHQSAKRLLKRFETKYETLQKPKKRPLSKTPKSNKTASVKKVKATTDVTDPSAVAAGPVEVPHTIVLDECERILRALMEHDCAVPFLEPVDPVGLGIPDYFTRIKNPMDLGTVKKKMSSYRQNKEFAQDVRQIWANCITFNGPDKGIARMASQLSQKFETLYARSGLSKKD